MALGAVAAFLDKPNSETDNKPDWTASMVGAVFLVVLVGVGVSQGWFKFQFGPEWISVLALLGLAGWRPGAKIGAVGLAGGIVAASSGLAPNQGQTLYLHLALLGVASLAFLRKSPIGGGSVALIGLAGVSTRYFLIPDPGKDVHNLPAALVLAVVITGILGLLIPKTNEALKTWTGPVLGLVLAGVTFAVGAALYHKDHMARTMLISAFIGVATAWAMPSGSKPEPVKVGLAALTWLGIATYAFSNSLTLGMGLALAAGAGAVVLSGSEAGLAMLAPLAGLVGQRLARNIYPDAVKAFDIGQHYAIVGLLVAVCLVMMVTNGFSTSRVLVEEGKSDWKPTAATIVGWALAVCAFLFSVIFLGPKGSTGLVIGAGLAALFVQLSKADGAGAAAVGVGFLGILGVAYPKLTALFDVSRAEKQGAFAVASVVGLVLALALVWLGRKPVEDSLETA